ncbi:hypothetical protein HDV00_009074 [Rhizophlyctis rosea]|nr:hypothetical protein HDV00_009074 [Rhizophlyctis rosea]
MVDQDNGSDMSDTSEHFSDEEDPVFEEEEAVVQPPAAPPNPLSDILQGMVPNGVLTGDKVSILLRYAQTAKFGIPTVICRSIAELDTFRHFFKSINWATLCRFHGPPGTRHIKSESDKYNIPILVQSYTSSMDDLPAFDALLQFVDVDALFSGHSMSLDTGNQKLDLLLSVIYLNRINNMGALCVLDATSNTNPTSLWFTQMLYMHADKITNNLLFAPKLASASAVKKHHLAVKRNRNRYVKTEGQVVPPIFLLYMSQPNTPSQELTDAVQRGLAVSVGSRLDPARPLVALLKNTKTLIKCGKSCLAKRDWGEISESDEEDESESGRPKKRTRLMTQTQHHTPAVEIAKRDIPNGRIFQEVPRELAILANTLGFGWLTAHEVYHPEYKNMKPSEDRQERKIRSRKMEEVAARLDYKLTICAREKSLKALQRYQNADDERADALISRSTFSTRMETVADVEDEKAYASLGAALKLLAEEVAAASLLADTYTAFKELLINVREVRTPGIRADYAQVGKDLQGANGDVVGKLIDYGALGTKDEAMFCIAVRFELGKLRKKARGSQV